jgi:hypothetical protein
LNGIIFPAHDGREPLLVGWTMTCVAVIVVLFVVPSTSTGSPVVTVLARTDFVPFR